MQGFGLRVGEFQNSFFLRRAQGLGFHLRGVESMKDRGRATYG